MVGPSAPTPELVIVGGEALGWCAVEPRSAYQRMLRNSRVPWEGRAEEKADSTVWASRASSRARASGAAASATHWRERASASHGSAGHGALEGYPMTTKEALQSELHVGTHAAFLAAGFGEVGRPTIRRAVMRVDL